MTSDIKQLRMTSDIKQLRMTSDIKQLRMTSDIKQLRMTMDSRWCDVEQPKRHGGQTLLESFSTIWTNLVGRIETRD
jgi:hypothetical protein